MQIILPKYECDSRVEVCGNGTYKVQLEIPPDSALNERDIYRIGQIASWKDGTIDEKIDGIEGGRSVVITKSKPRTGRVEERGLQISGVCFTPLEFHEKVSNLGSRTASFVTAEFSSTAGTEYTFTSINKTKTKITISRTLHLSQSNH